MSTMQRNCPVCHEKLSSNDHFFCGSCGSILESSLIQQIDVSKKIIDLDKRHPVKNPHTTHIRENVKDVVHMTNIKGIIVLLLTLAFVGIPLYVFLTGLHNDISMMFYTPRNKISTRPLATIKETSQTTNSVILAVRPGNFTLNEQMRYVPYNIDVLFEGADIESALDLLRLNDKSYTDLANLLSKHVTGSYVGYTILKDSTVSWAIIMRTKENQDLGDFVINDKYSWLYSLVDSNVIVLTNNKDFIATSESLSSNLEKNVNMNPAFANLRSTIPSSGRLNIISLTGEGKDYLSKLIEPGMPVFIKDFVMSSFTKNRQVLFY